MQITINKTGLVLETGDFPANSKDFIFNYGLRQILNDCHSSIQAKDFETTEAWHEAVNAAVQAKLSALESGDLTIRRTSSEPVDPVERVALRMAREAVKSALKANGLTVKKIGQEKFDELAAGHLDKNGDAIRKLAKAEVKRQADAASAVEIDLSSLMA